MIPFAMIAGVTSLIGEMIGNSITQRDAA